MSDVNQQSMLPIGTVVGGRYRIVRYLSSGGFGNTYEAEHTDLGNRCAIKEYFVDGMTHRGHNGLSVEVSNTQNLNIYNSQLDKFRQEAQLLNKMQHPGIVRVHDLFVDNQTAYYAMDIIDGQSLAAILKQNGPLSEQQALRYISQVLDALAYVHSRGLLHLDIKPGNIMIDRATDRAVLIDFGATKQFDRSSTGFSSTAPAFTKGYAPPEQINYNKVKIGPWTDLYALGATLFTLTTGEFPPLSDDITDYEDAAFRFAADATPAFRQLVVWLMQQPTKKRPQSVAEVQQRLAQPTSQPHPSVKPKEEKASPSKTEQKKPQPTKTEEVATPKTTPLQSKQNPKTKSRKWTWIIAALGVIAVMAIVLIVLNRPGPKPEPTPEPKNRVSKENVGNGIRYSIDGVSFTMIEVPGGTFTMGATAEQGRLAFDNEKPTHSVTLSSYMIGQTEVTQELWQAVMGSNPSYPKGENLPVENVSWDDCQTFIAKLNRIVGETFRLPTEAEWEYAARGGQSGGTKYAGSNNINDVAWYSWGNYSPGGYDQLVPGNFGGTPHPVAIKKPNALGLYDMSGNVSEWCQDWYDAYSSVSQTNPKGASSGTERVIRGDFFYDSYCRVSYRTRRPSDYVDTYGGVRLAR